MRVSSCFATACIGTLSLSAMPVSALQCEKAPADLAVAAQAEQTVESTAYSCVLEGEAAIHLAGKLTSSLARGRGMVEVRFAGQEKAFRRGPWVGTFSDYTLDESIPVPRGATRVSVVAKVESGRKDATGTWRIIAPVLSPGVFIAGESAKDTVISASKRVFWRFSTVPADARGEFQMELRNPAGQTVVKRAIRKTENQTEINFGVLPVGYYRALARFIPEDDRRAGIWTSALVVLPDGAPPNEPRFGMDGALSWLGGTPDMIARSVIMMRQAGIGSVRDRLKWSQIQPTQQQGINWGHYEDNAKTVARAGMELVQVFHDAPDWTRPAGISPASALPPLDNAAVFEFGRAYAKGLGKTVRSVEYWNEQNTVFFAGYPFQYANGLKAFFDGIKSTDPGIRVLIGSSAGKPGRFFDEIFRNNVASFFDTRNQHFYGNQHTYGKDIELDTFLDQNVADMERRNNFDKKPGWMTETGYSLQRDEHGDWQATEIKQAEYLVKTYASGFSTGYERVFFFLWRELVEANSYTWGIVREDFSPRPAYLALALLTRYLEGASVVAAERHGEGRTVYFRRKDGKLIAITWGGGAAITRLGTRVEVRNIFGQQLDLASPEARGPSPLLLSQVDKLPDNAKQINLPEQALLGPAPLRLETRLLVNGKDQIHLAGDPVAISIGNGATVEVLGRVYSSSHGTPTVRCIPGPGLVASPAQLSQPGEPFSCRFVANLTEIGESYVTVQARVGENSDTVRIALAPDTGSIANTGTFRPLRPGGECPRWAARQSKNITLTINAKAACAVSVMSHIDHQGDSWVFPAVSIPVGELAGAIGLRLRLTTISGYALPPTPLMLQLVEKSGGIWVVNLQRNEEGKNKIYSGLFNLASPAPWARDDNGQLDLGNVREIMFGWGGYGGIAGQQHGFTVEAMDVLLKNP